MKKKIRLLYGKPIESHSKEVLIETIAMMSKQLETNNARHLKDMETLTGLHR